MEPEEYNVDEYGNIIPIMDGKEITWPTAAASDEPLTPDDLEHETGE